MLNSFIKVLLQIHAQEKTMSMTREAVEMERVARLMPLGNLSDLKTFLSFCNTRYPIEKERIIEVVRSFSGSIKGLEQEFIDNLSRDIQMIIVRKAVDEVEIEDVRFVQTYINNRLALILMTEPLTFYSLVGEVLRYEGGILITYPFKIELYWNEDLARLFGCDCAERVIYIYKKHKPFLNNNRLELEYVLDTSRKYAFGETTKDELDLAQRSIQYIIQDIGSVHLKEDTGLCSILHSILSNTALHIFNKRPVLAWNTWRQDNAWEIAQNSAPSTPKLFDEFVWQFKRIFEYFLGERTVETERKKYLDNSIP